eukprot:TRINITY_DN15138_c0_g1_i1.p5 TRINITY_DN15138_c0_g1~~TRINITY_DN15138_c0_g1_i1.p5  ORF type:complete len:73 (-),score=13.41 TRINITY_DN15138_c0_g1_i1:64-282(-)
MQSSAANGRGAAPAAGTHSRPNNSRTQSTTACASCTERTEQPACSTGYDTTPGSTPCRARPTVAAALANAPS